MGAHMVPKSHTNRPVGRPWLCFLDFVRFWKDVSFDEFLVLQNVGPKSQISIMLAAKLIPGGWFWGGWRERRRAGEEKELGG